MKRSRQMIHISIYKQAIVNLLGHNYKQQHYNNYLILYSAFRCMAQREDPLQDQNTKEFNSIPEEIVMQKLSHYFLTPTLKMIPYSHYFQKSRHSAIYCLAYLYNFARSVNHSKVVLEILMNLLPIKYQSPQDWTIHEEKSLKIVNDIIESSEQILGSRVTRKTLLARYISLPSSMAQHLANMKISCPQMQAIVVRDVCRSLDMLSSQESIYAINKIIMLGHCHDLLETELIGNNDFKHVIKNYELIVKKDAVMLELLKLILNQQKFLISSEAKEMTVSTIRQLIKSHHLPTSYDTIVRLINNPAFEPHQAKQFYQILIEPFSTLQESLFQDLLVWWTLGNDHYLIHNSIKFRTNLMALSMNSFDKNTLLKYSGQISLGIQNRLLIATQNKKEVVNLIWAILAKSMEFQLPPQFSTQLLQSDAKIIEKQQSKAPQKQAQPNNKTIIDRDVQNEESQCSNYPQYNGQVIIKRPLNIYDCLLGLKNSNRRKVALEVMPNMIRANPQDLIFMWRDLINQLIYNLSKDTSQSVRALFVTRPQPFIESIGDIFFMKDHSLNDKIILMEVLNQGTQQLANKPIATAKQKHKQEFYFKKVTSKYYNESQSNKKNQSQKNDERTRRWGHTRIAHEKKLKQNPSGAVSLKIIDNQPYINRLYEIANQLFFRIISKLALLPIFPSQPMFSVPMLKLLATLSQNLKNHIQKYKILTQVIDICLHVVEYIEKSNKKAKEKQLSMRADHLKKWKDTCLAVLNTLNKISLVVDKYIPNRMLQHMQKCIIKLKSIPQYGINPIINMIEANIYTNVSGQKIHF